jgi:hypothetical protein
MIPLTLHLEISDNGEGFSGESERSSAAEPPAHV